MHTYVYEYKEETAESNLQMRRRKFICMLNYLNDKREKCCLACRILRKINYENFFAFIKVTDDGLTYTINSFKPENVNYTSFKITTLNL